MRSRTDGSVTELPESGISPLEAEGGMQPTTPGRGCEASAGRGVVEQIMGELRELVRSRG